MTYVVTDNCIRCKYTDCVEVCPVDCFYEELDHQSRRHSSLDDMQPILNENTAKLLNMADAYPK